MKTRFLILAASALAAASCTDGEKPSGSSGSETVTASPSNEGKKSDKIRNGVVVKESGGLEVEQAFLLTDDGQLIDEANTVPMAENVNLRLIIKGWEETDGKVTLGASEQVATSEGDIVLNQPDLFGSMGAVSATDAQFVTLKAVVTRVNKLYDYFQVNYRVWDKSPGGGEVSGSYRFKIK